MFLINISPLVSFPVTFSTEFLLCNVILNIYLLNVTLHNSNFVTHHNIRNENNDFFKKVELVTSKEKKEKQYSKIFLSNVYQSIE